MSSIKIYYPPAVTEIQHFYGDLLYKTDWYYQVQEHLTMIAKRLWWGMKDGNPAVRHEVSNHHPKYLGKPFDAFQENNWTLEDAKIVISRGYGFDDWAELEELEDQPYDEVFEEAVNMLLSGEEDVLRRILEENPEVIETRSKYGHKATLLHYVSSNAVEIWRQQVPENLPALTSLLLEKGADKDVTMYAYGKEVTVLELLESSAHPYAAGIDEQMLELLS